MISLTLRTVQHKEVWKAIHHHAEVCQHPFVPLLVQVKPVASLDSERPQPTGNGVVTGTYRYDVKFSIFAVGSSDTLLCKFRDWGICNRSLWVITSLIVVLL